MDAEAKRLFEERQKAAAEAKRLAETPLTADQKRDALASLESGDANKVLESLKKSAGRTIEVPLEKLSDADRQYVEKMQAAKKPATNPFEENPFQ